MKLLVCDVEGTIFMPHRNKDYDHPSYIWAGLAEELGRRAVEAERASQQKWKNSVDGHNYIKWVEATIKMHKTHGLTEKRFYKVVDDAKYFPGCVEFFRRLDRNEYKPILISGGIKQFSSRACRDLGVKEEDSYVACSYFFANGKIDLDLCLFDSCNFYGKQEIVKIVLKKYGLGKDDWVFMGDGPNDVSAAESAPISIGISPLPKLKKVVDYSFSDFNELMNCSELLEKTKLLKSDETRQYTDIPMEFDGDLQKYGSNEVTRQIKNFYIRELQTRAQVRLKNHRNNDDDIARLSGIPELLCAAEETLFLYESISRDESVIRDKSISGRNNYVSALLQPFCCAAEIMLNVSIVLLSEAQQLKHIDLKSGFTQKLKFARSEWRQLVFTAIDDYKKLRNISAHCYKSIPLKAARAYAQITYEIIQRLAFWCENPGIY